MLVIEVMKLKGKVKGWWWRIKSYNGEILAHSEEYTTKKNAIKTAKLIMHNYEWSLKVK